MIKISDVVYDIIKDNPSLNFAFHHRLLNLSQAARFIRPTVETRARKEVSESAVLMNLSRLQNRMGDTKSLSQNQFFLDKVTIHAGLCNFTLPNTSGVVRKMSQLLAKVREGGGYITITEGMSEVTAIMSNEYYDIAVEMFEETHRNVNRNLASVGVKFADKIIDTPGFIYQILQQIVLQNINVIEVASTATEFNIYVAEHDVEDAFEAIYRRFVYKRRN